MTVQVVKINVGSQAELVKFVRDLLDRCESGQVTGLTILEEMPNATYRVHGTSTMSRLQTAGALLEAAVSRLQQ